LKSHVIVLALLLVSLPCISPAGEKETEAEKGYYVEIITLKIENIRKLREKDEIIESLKKEIAEKEIMLEESCKNIDALTKKIKKMLADNNSLPPVKDEFMFLKEIFYPSGKDVKLHVRELVCGYYKIRGLK